MSHLLISFYFIFAMGSMVLEVRRFPGQVATPGKR
jgi:hypothetical protein